MENLLLHRSNSPMLCVIYLDAFIIVTWTEGDAKAVAALLQLSLTLSRAGDHAHPVQEGNAWGEWYPANWLITLDAALCPARTALAFCPAQPLSWPAASPPRSGRSSGPTCPSQSAAPCTASCAGASLPSVRGFGLSGKIKVAITRNLRLVGCVNPRPASERVPRNLF